MLKRRMIISAGLVLVLVASAVGAVFAQDSDSSSANPLPTAVCRQQDRIADGVSIYTEALGMTVVEIRAYLADGGTLEELAAEKGVDLTAVHDQLRADALAELETCLNDAVTSGTITQAQADWVLQMAQLSAQRPELLASCRPFAGQVSLMDLAAEALGMTVEEIQAYLEDGGTLRELLAEQELDLDALQEQVRSTVTSELETCLSEAVASGDITQVQADYLLEQAQNFELRGGFFGMGGERGGFPFGMGERGLRGDRDSMPRNQRGG